MVSAGQLTLIGLIVNTISGLVVMGFELRPINRFGQFVWPRYRRITKAGEKLRKKGKITSDDYGFSTLVNEVEPHDDIVGDENWNLTTQDIKYESIEFEEKDSSIPLGKRTVVINIVEADHKPDNYSLDLTARMSWKTMRTIVNNNTQRGFLKAGGWLLFFGFLFQAYAQFSRIHSLNLISCL